MDVLTAILDVLFLFIAIAFFPSSGYFSPPPGAVHPLSPPPSASAHTPPLVSPVAVPLITVTPERPSHKRKNVSFSLTSMDDLEPEPVKSKPRRPPTPYVSGPVSPSEGKGKAEMPSLPTTPIEHSRLAVDPMGIQKAWLMP